MIPFIWPFGESEATMVNRSGARNWGKRIACKEGWQELSDLMEMFSMILVIVT